ncbi:hypothetical protein F6X34_02215 [Dickeya dianthicola]|nr:hypothetical protein [Dickeya dianthicola]
MPLCRLSEPAARRRVTLCIGVTQLINWGTAFYLPGVFCAPSRRTAVSADAAAPATAPAHLAAR